MKTIRVKPKYIGRIRERILLVSDDKEKIVKAMKMRGEFKSNESRMKLMTLGYPIIINLASKIADIIKIGEIREIMELFNDLNDDNIRDRLMRMIPKEIELIDNRYLEIKKYLPRIISIDDDIRHRAVKNSKMYKYDEETGHEYCEWNDSYWLFSNMSYYTVMVIPKNMNIEEIPEYLDEEDIKKILEFKIHEKCVNEICDKAREIKAMIALLEGRFL